MKRRTYRGNRREEVYRFADGGVAKKAIFMTPGVLARKRTKPTAGSVGKFAGIEKPSRVNSIGWVYGTIVIIKIDAVNEIRFCERGAAR